MSDIASVEPWQACDEVRWLAGEALGGGFGAGVEVVVPAGARYDVHSIGDNERVVYVYDGEGIHRGSGGPTEVATDDVLVLPPGAWHGFENTGARPARVWIVWTPAVVFPHESFRRAGDDDDFGGSVIKRKLRGETEDPASTPRENGFENLGIIWTGAEGAQAITLGYAHFETGGTHHMHRHPHGDEVLHVAHGVGQHVTREKVEAMEGPAYEFSPAGEWHKMIVTEGRMEGVFVYLGGNTLESAGYELEQ